MILRRIPLQKVLRPSTTTKKILATDEYRFTLMNSSKIELNSSVLIRVHLWPKMYFLDIEVHAEFVGVWPGSNGIDFVISLVFDPVVNHVRREDIAFEQELMIVL